MMAEHGGTVRRIAVNGLSLACSVYGRKFAPTVIFAHGGGQTRYAWKGAAKSLGEQGYYTVALDLRGHGDSEWAKDGDYSLEASRKTCAAHRRGFARRAWCHCRCWYLGTQCLCLGHTGRYHT